MRIDTLEKRLQVLYLVRQATIDNQTIKEIVKDYNKYNLLYAKKTGRNYIPR
jgi:hypothetical protein